MPIEVTDTVVPISRLADDGNLCGECPLWNSAEQSLYWTDAGSGKLYRYVLPKQQHELILDNFEVNGFAFDESGDLTLVNNQGVWLWNRSANPAHAVSEVEGEKLRLNDCIADPAGRLLGGSSFYDPSSEYEAGCLFMIESDGSGTILDEGFHLANGLGFSPDSKTLYFNDSIARKVYCYQYDVAKGRISDRRVFAELEPDAGLPDGLTVDALGFVWCAEWYGGRISRFDPTGRLERRILVPAKQTSSLAFGGDALTDIFVTSAAKSEPTPVMPPHYDPVCGYFGGAVFRLNVGIVGRPEYRTRFRPRG